MTASGRLCHSLAKICGPPNGSKIDRCSLNQQKNCIDCRRVGHRLDPSMDWIGCDDCDPVFKLSIRCSTVNAVSYEVRFMNV